MPQDSDALVLARRHARSTVSFQTLGWDLQRRFYDEAYVAYAEAGDCWMVVGGPIAAPERELDVLRRFMEDARAQHKRVRIFATEQDLSEAGFGMLHLGDQPIWDPTLWPQGLSKRLRGQLRRARAKGLVTTRPADLAELQDRNHPTRRGIERIVQQWLESRPMPPLDFVLRLELFSRLSERRFFVAESAGEVVGVLVALPIYGREGWYIDNTLRGATAPNGTMDLLFDCAMQTFAAEGSRRVTLGVTPLKRVSSRILQLLRALTGSFYNYDGLHAFKAKLGPQVWEPVYLAHPRDEHPARATLGLFTHFLGGSWLRYAGRSFTHCATWTAGLCAALLVPWTLGLALAPREPWFPSQDVRVGWIALCTSLLAGLCALTMRWRRRLAIATSAACLLSALLSTAQIASYNAVRARGGDWLWLAFGTLAPLLTATFLWASRDRLNFYGGVASTAEGSVESTAEGGVASTAEGVATTPELAPSVVPLHEDAQAWRSKRARTNVA